MTGHSSCLAELEGERKFWFGLEMGMRSRAKFIDSRMRTWDRGTLQSWAVFMAVSRQSDEAMMRLDLPCLTWRESSVGVKAEEAAE